MHLFIPTLSYIISKIGDTIRLSEPDYRQLKSVSGQWSVMIER